MKKIDTHCHLYPPEYMNEVGKRNLFKTNKPPVWISLDERINKMDAYGIETQVLSLSNPLTYFGDDGLNLHLAQLTNDYISDTCRKNPARFKQFAILPLENIKNAMDELDRVRKSPGFAGLVIGAHINGKRLASPEFITFFEEVNRMGTIIFVHPVWPVGIEKENEYRDFYRSVGFLWETTMAIGRLAISGYFERYPKIKWILSHLGGTIPFVYTSFDVCQKRNPNNEPMAPQPASEYLRKIYVDTARHFTEPILNCAIDLYGEDHIVFGSDIPFAYDVTKMNIEMLDRSEYPIQTKQKICYENARGLLNK